MSTGVYPHTFLSGMPVSLSTFLTACVYPYLYLSIFLTFLYLCVYLPYHLCLPVSTHLHFEPSMSNCQSIYLFYLLCLSGCLCGHLCLSVYTFTFLTSIHICISLSNFLTMCVYLRVNLFNHVCLYLPTYLSLSH